MLDTGGAFVGETPETKYAKSGDLHIAYQAVGNGPPDLVFVPGWISHVELAWEEPAQARFFRRLSAFTRLIMFDKRGTGLSDRVPVERLPLLEERMDDVRAVMDAVGSRRSTFFGMSDGGAISALFAATYPERTAALILYGAFARTGAHLMTTEELEARLATIEQNWPASIDPTVPAPSRAVDEDYREWFHRFMKHSASPGAAVALLRMNSQIDIRHLLPTIRVPTLVMYRRDARFGHGAAAWRHEGADVLTPAEQGRYMAERIPGAKLVELPGIDHLPWVGESDKVIDEVEEFLTGVRHGPEPDRVLATILVTDIVGSTEIAARQGDRRWRELLERYYALARRQLERFRGRVVDTAGDGLLAAFDGPARAIRCAQAIVEAVTALDLQIRAGLHTGECELVSGRLMGIAVHIASRVAAAADPGEVLVSSTVKDLVVGAGFDFSDRGVYSLKGVPGEWRLYAVPAGV
jgi:class 3 adenylate cyclase